MQPNEILKLFKDKSALLEGHFELASQKHSPFYLQCALILQYPEHTAALCKILADHYRKDSIDVVAGPAIGGIILAYALAEALGVRSIYAERKEQALELRRGFEIKKGGRILLVEDVITTGGSILELASLCETKGAAIVGFASLVNRSGGVFKSAYPLKALLEVDFPTYERRNCPLCRQGIPATKPGSQKRVKEVV